MNRRAGAISLAGGIGAAVLLHLDTIGRSAEESSWGSAADLAHWTAEVAVASIVGGSIWALLRARSRRVEAR